MIFIGNKGRRALDDLSLQIDLLNQLQPDQLKPFFVARTGSDSAVSRRTFRIQINHQQASQLIGKHIRSHSFRATFGTDLLANGLPIEKAQDLLGHASPVPTAMYRRSKVTKKEIHAIVNTVNKARQGAFNSADAVRRRKRSADAARPASGKRLRLNEYEIGPSGPKKTESDLSAFD
jgi:site-specific recombinase XerD